MDLEINREKTRVVDLKQKGTSLDFLGFTLRYDLDRFWSWASLPECGSVEEVSGAGRGETANPDGPLLGLEADPDPDRRSQSAPEKLGQLLSIRVSESCFRDDQPVRGDAASAASPSTQSTALPYSGRG